VLSGLGGSLGRRPRDRYARNASKWAEDPLAVSVGQERGSPTLGAAQAPRVKVDGAGWADPGHYTRAEGIARTARRQGSLLESGAP